MSAGCAWLIGGTRWLGAGRKLAHRGRADDQLAPPAKPDSLLEQQPGGGRLPAARPPPGDYPGPRRRCAGGGPCGPAGESRAHRRLIQFSGPRPVLHAAGSPLFTATCVTNGAAINRRRTVGPKVCTHGVHPAPRGLASSLTRAPESRRSVLGRKARP